MFGDISTKVENQMENKLETGDVKSSWSNYHFYGPKFALKM